MTATMVFVLTTAQRFEVLAALTVYKEDLSKLAKKAEDLGKLEAADHWKAEASAIDEQLRPRVREQGAELLTKELVIIRSALGRYVKKLTAAASTVESLYEETMAVQLRAKASQVTESTIPVFEEQIALELGMPSGKAERRKPDPTGLKATADREADPADNVQSLQDWAAQGGTPTKPRRGGKKGKK